MHRATIAVPTPGRGFFDITDEVARVVAAAGVPTGLCHLFLQHTSASLVVQENWDRDVLRDLSDWLSRAAPDGDPRYRHRSEGPDDMPGHIRAMLTATSLTLPVAEGRLALGRWQAVYLAEHRTTQHERRVVVTVWG